MTCLPQIDPASVRGRWWGGGSSVSGTSLGKARRYRSLHHRDVLSRNTQM
jgi:hypothetical protein